MPRNNLKKSIPNPTKSRIIAVRKSIRSRKISSLVWYGFLVVALGVGVFLATSTQANVSYFYFSSCLGDWQFPAQASGIPETSKDTQEFTEENSAKLEKKVGSLFCGTPVGEYPENKEISSVKLTFSWKIIASSPEITINPAVVEDGLITNPATTTVDISTSTEELSPAASSTPIVEPEPAQSEATSTPDEVPEEIAATSTPPVPPDPEPAPTENPITDSPVSLFSPHIAYAQEIETATVTEGVINDEDESFIEILYTLNGEEWVSLGKLDAESAENISYHIPVKDRNQLSELQVHVYVYRTPTNNPTLLVDALPLEVTFKESEYIELPKNPTPVMDLVEPSVVDTSPDLKITEDAKHSCSLEPFTQKVKRGGTIDFDISRTPYEKESPTKIFMGALPEGIRGEFVANSLFNPGKEMIRMTATKDALPGSYSIVVLYEEGAFSPSRTSCQLNLVVE